MSFPICKLEIGDTYVFSEKVWLDEWMHYVFEFVALNPKIQIKILANNGWETSTEYFEYGKVIKITTKGFEIALEKPFENRIIWQMDYLNKR